MTLDWHAVDPHPIQSQRPHTRDASTIHRLLKQLSHSSTYGLIIQSNGAVVKPGYSALYSGCAFFLYRGYFIIRPVILTPYQKKLPVLFYKPGAPGVTMVPHHAYHSGLCVMVQKNRPLPFCTGAYLILKGGREFYNMKSRTNRVIHTAPTISSVVIVCLPVSYKWIGPTACISLVPSSKGPLSSIPSSMISL